MFEKNLMMSYLLDFYGEVLDSHTHSLMAAYYDDDLSLAEIAQDAGISRQGVRHIIKKGEEQLLFLEARLGLAERNKRLLRVAKRLSDIIGGLSDENALFTSALRDTEKELSDIIERQ